MLRILGDYGLAGLGIMRNGFRILLMLVTLGHIAVLRVLMRPADYLFMRVERRGLDCFCSIELVTHISPFKLAACMGGPQDRKSTRLNSSHSQISYAVFCLKKKKTNN